TPTTSETCACPLRISVQAPCNAVDPDAHAFSMLITGTCGGTILSRMSDASATWPRMLVCPHAPIPELANHTVSMGAQPSKPASVSAPTHASRVRFWNDRSGHRPNGVEYDPMTDTSWLILAPPARLD